VGRGTSGKRYKFIIKQHHALLKDENLSRQENEKCKDILGRLENNESVERLFKKLSLNLKTGDLVKMK